MNASVSIPPLIDENERLELNQSVEAEIEIDPILIEVFLEEA